jgi:hypothetical protein
MVMGKAPLSKSAFRVAEHEKFPGQLYFCDAPDFNEQIPEDQDLARRQLEDFATVLRVVFQASEPPLFQELFNRVLAIAQATFGPSGFRRQPLSDLAPFKREVVQIAGARIKARYNARLLKAVLIASGSLLVTGFALAFVGNAVGVSNVQQPANLPAWLVSPIFNTGVLLAASMWGLFFASAARNLDPTFETLLTPDADLIVPWVRLVFFGIAIFVIALIFELGVVTLSFADRVSTNDIASKAGVALFFGLLLGIAERALPREVELWSKRVLPSAKQVTNST